MSASTFWTVKAVLAWVGAGSGLWWADDPLSGRVWMLLLAVAITFTLMSVMFRQDERRLDAFQAGLELRETWPQAGVSRLVPRRRGLS